MSEKGYTVTDEKVLAMNYALTALLNLLQNNGHIQISDYVKELDGAFGALLRADETGAAALIEAYRSHLCTTFRIPNSSAE